MRDVTVIIPTLNEEGNIGKLIKEICTKYPGIHINVMDDGSKDKTGEIVEYFGKKYPNISFTDRKNCLNKGLTASVLDGIMNTLTPYFIVMDADFQHPISKLRDFGIYLKAGADIVVGVRKSTPKEWGVIRKLMSSTATLMANARLLTQMKNCRDPMSGFFGGNTKKVRSVIEWNMERFELKGYKVLFDLLKLIPDVWFIEYVEYDFGLRTAGESKISSKHIKSFVKSLFK
jgi:dolichol-phosphate mannosyltransferase